MGKGAGLLNVRVAYSVIMAEHVDVLGCPDFIICVRVSVSQIKGKSNLYIEIVLLTLYYR